MYDYIIVGTGYGGLSTAALLAQHGFKVLVLEAHTAIGGCASYFRRKQFSFDVGATTFSGLLPHQPFGVLFKTLGIKPEVIKIDPGMIVHLPDTTVSRYADPTAWIHEATTRFGSSKQRSFWEHVHDVDRTIWALLSQNETIPPSGLSEWVRLIKLQNLKAVSLIPGLFRPFKEVLQRYLLDGDERFVRFVDEQLLISTQNTSANAPWITSVMGLAYPAETYYPMGGMVNPLAAVLESYTASGNVILFKEQVNRIKQTADGYEVFTRRGSHFSARGVVSNIPIWNMAKVTEGKPENYFTKLGRRFEAAWGAFTVYFAVEDFGELNSLYHQVHTGIPVPHCGGKSFFVSFSHRDDRQKAPPGWRTVTISTHTPVNTWRGMSKDTYEKRKSDVVAFILDRLDASVEGISRAGKKFVLTGTPASFEFYTGRHNGFVGGIPHSVEQNLLSMPSGITPFRNLYCVGDTMFPGQGTPSVVLGALNVVRHVLRKS